MKDLAPRLVFVITLLGLLAGCKNSSGESPPSAVAGDVVQAGPGGIGAPPTDSPRFRQVDVVVDWHNRKTPDLAEGEFDLLTLSTLPDTVTGGDVLMAIRGLAPEDELRVELNGEDVTGRFAQVESGEWLGLVGGLAEGRNEVQAFARGPAGLRRARLELTNHPISGPVISGPHQQPFYCRTEQAGLGAPLDENCSAATRYQWFYRSVDQAFHELENPHGPYPDDLMYTATSSGESVPWVVRMETTTINRGIARLAVLDDPAARAPGEAFEPLHWNRRVYYVFGESCGVGYHQGNSQPALVLGGFPDAREYSGDNLLITLAGVSDRLGAGDVVVHNTLTSFGVHCNPMVSMETAMMMREYITERYGVIRQVVGTNGSGAALQQYNLANNAPGLLSAGLPTATFADIPSTAMTVADCGLLQSYYRRDDVELNDMQQAAINGHNLLSGNSANAICASWEGAFLDRIDPTTGCNVPEEERYHPENNPDGVRCTLQDGNKNLFGTDPETGFARRPLDNHGIQYGLAAFNGGVISFEEFVVLNRDIGGYDIDGRIVPERMKMDPELEALLYRVGAVIGRGALDETPFLDLAPYLDLVPVANIHEAVRPFTIRARLRNGGSDVSQSIFRGVLTQPDVFPVIDEWLARIEEADRGYGLDPAVTLADNKPYEAEDRCSFGTVGGRLELPRRLLLPLGAEAPLLPQLEAILPLPGVELLAGSLPDAEASVRVDIPEDFDSGLGPCSIALPVTGTPRMAAGGPLSDDVLRCQLKAVDRNDYVKPLTDEQVAMLESVFPEGVCDYSRPAAFDVAESLIWPSLGGRELASEPFGLQWQAARALPVPRP